VTERILDFEQVWRKILQVAKEKGEVCTLTQKIPNQIVSVSESAITVMSERTGYRKTRELTKEDFRSLWEVLMRRGKLNVEDILHDCYNVYWKKIGRIMMTFLAFLSDVEYSTRPQQTLYLMPTNTHLLGTKREHKMERRATRNDDRSLSCELLREAFRKAVREYGEDEDVLHYVGKGIKERSCLTPQDLFYIICWKAPSDEVSRGKATNNAFECIRRIGAKGIENVTKEAIKLAERDEIEKSIEKLTELHGVKTRVASAILTFYNPEKFGVMDKRAWKALYNEEKEDFEPKDYVKYLKDIRELAKKCRSSPLV